MLNDLATDGEALQIVSCTQPARGEVSQNADGSLRYVPHADFTEGTDSFQYTIQDDDDTGSVRVSVSAAANLIAGAIPAPWAGIPGCCAGNAASPVDPARGGRR